MSYTVLARKYRPNTFAKVCGQEHIVRIFQNALKTNKIAQAYLFTGSRGVGKTSVARILAKALNCHNNQNIEPCNKCPICHSIDMGNNTDVLEIDGASNTGVDDIRDLQKDLLYATTQSKHKIIIIDEVHMLSKNAFNALLKTLEEPPRQIVFIFATTEPHKVLPTIISRCQRFDFKRLTIESIVENLKNITQLEHINIEIEALFLIAKKADGGMRDALSLLDQVISYGEEKITALLVEEIFGLLSSHIFHLFLQFIIERNPAEVLALYKSISERGIDFQEFLNNFLDYLKNLLFLKIGYQSPLNSLDNNTGLEQLLQRISEDELVYLLNYLIETKNTLRTSSAPEISLEITLVKLSRISEMKSLKNILENLPNIKVQYQELLPPLTADNFVYKQPQKKNAASFDTQDLPEQSILKSNIPVSIPIHAQKRTVLNPPHLQQPESNKNQVLPINTLNQEQINEPSITNTPPLAKNSTHIIKNDSKSNSLKEDFLYKTKSVLISTS